MTTNIMAVRDHRPIISPAIKDLYATLPEPCISLTEDPLLLSCVLYRLNNEKRSPVADYSFESNLTSAFVKAQITEEDRDFAATVRRHYNDKIVLTTLRGDRITPFREELSKFLSSEFSKVSDNYQLPIKFQGMVYKLPYFYTYDKELYTVFDSEYHSLKTEELNYETEKQKLTFIKKIMAYRKGRHPHEYWFRDHKDDRIMLSIEARAPLVDLFDHYLTTNDHVTVRGTFRAARKDTLEYYRAASWVLNV